jgi:hypothetical protein
MSPIALVQRADLHLHSVQSSVQLSLLHPHRPILHSTAQAPCHSSGSAKSAPTPTTSDGTRSTPSPAAAASVPDHQILILPRPRRVALKKSRHSPSPPLASSAEGGPWPRSRWWRTAAAVLGGMRRSGARPAPRSRTSSWTCTRPRRTGTWSGCGGSSRRAPPPPRSGSPTETATTRSSGPRSTTTRTSRYTSSKSVPSSLLLSLFAAGSYLVVIGASLCSVDVSVGVCSTGATRTPLTTRARPRCTGRQCGVRFRWPTC